MGFSGAGAQQHLSTPVQEESSFPSGAVHHPAEKPALNTHWCVFCVPPGTNTPMRGDAGAPSRAGGAALPRLMASSLSSQAPQSGTQHSWAPAPCKRKAAAGCIAKPCVGSFLATHGISSYCFSSLRLLLQSLAKGRSVCCLQLLSFTGHAGEAAVQGLPGGFLSSFLCVVPQLLAQRTLSNSSTCCGAELPCPCYTVTSHTHAHKNQKQQLQGHLRGA